VCETLVMKKGVVKFFNRKSKFGFIRDLESGSEYYVHIKDVTGSIDEGVAVTFELREEKRGPAAVNVVVEQKNGADPK
jgi:cold shock protein